MLAINGWVCKRMREINSTCIWGIYKYTAIHKNIQSLYLSIFRHEMCNSRPAETTCTVDAWVSHICNAWKWQVYGWSQNTGNIWLTASASYQAVTGHASLSTHSNSDDNLLQEVCCVHIHPFPYFSRDQELPSTCTCIGWIMYNYHPKMHKLSLLLPHWCLAIFWQIKGYRCSLAWIWILSSYAFPLMLTLVAEEVGHVIELLSNTHSWWRQYV